MCMRHAAVSSRVEKDKPATGVCVSLTSKEGEKQLGRRNTIGNTWSWVVNTRLWLRKRVVRCAACGAKDLQGVLLGEHGFHVRAELGQGDAG